ncbi:hypothetical protein TTHERM_00013620 (macronuclear) [Tetrahymena thermophila SB210]|uniref:Uncharacterized protein n=1 Tax=Tetrahymena thermophila (strain SB210) TaxID=312017 RepID=Q22RM6_TETTS|nr:hypothetical protein TTHERM_00013620 [Tetrahymena thermophila SB210]EAR88096.1 hypothetical protein TTHERM_00013620 [Tetrahymena thermophila SB210]|eukprot:XP_001008341.1 hypothetical protein TTHERM_00013620 [Tetrahymena thermophila SB210]
MEDSEILETQIVDLTQQKKNLEKKLAEETQKLTQSNADKQNLNNQVSTLNCQLSQEKNKVSNLTTQLETDKKNLNQQLTTEKDKNTNLTKQLDDLRKELTDQTNNLKSELAQQKEKTKVSEDQNKTLTEQITNANNLLALEKDNQVKLKNGFEDEKKSLNQTVQKTQKELEVLKSENKTMKNSIEELNKQLSEMKQNLQEKIEGLDLANKKLSEQEQEILNLKLQKEKIIKSIKKKKQIYFNLEQKFNDGQSQNKKLQSTLDDSLRQQNQFKQEIIQFQERIQALTEENKRFQNQLQVVSKEPQSIQQFQTTSYDQQLNLTDLFKKKPQIKDFFNFQYEESEQNVTVSLLSYSKGSSYILSQILEKNITKQKNNDNSIFIHNHKVNELQSSLFLNTKKMGQPITCYKKNEHNNQSLKMKHQYFDQQEIQNQQMIQSFLIDLVSNISDVQILVVNEVTEQEQNLIMKLKSDFLQNKYAKNDKQLIIIHLLTQYDEEQIEEYSQNIQGFFKLTEKYHQNNKYFKDQDYKNISHFVIGNEYLQEKEKYFTFPIYKIKQMIFEEMFIDGYSIYDRIQEFLNKYYSFYVQIDNQDDIKRQYLEQQPLLKNDRNQIMMSSNQNDQDNICENNQIKELFIRKDNNLILNEELYDFLEVKNYNYKLQQKTITEVNYRLEVSNDQQQLLVIIEIPAKVEQAKIELCVNTNKLLIFAQKLIPNSNKFQKIIYQLQNHIFQYYEIFKEQPFQNKDGAYIVCLKRIEKYSQQKLAQLCKNFEYQFQLNQFDFNSSQQIKD